MSDDRTLDLFAEPSPRTLGDAGRDAGIKTAVDHAEAEIEDWHRKAYEFIVSYAARRKPFTCPEVRAAAEATGFALPPTAFAWGGPMQRASRNRVIQRAGYVQYGDGTMHTQGVSLWIAKETRQ